MNKSLDVLYQVAFNKIASQLDASKSLDTKAAIVLAVYGVIISSVVAKLPNKIEPGLLSITRSNELNLTDKSYLVRC